MRDRSGAALLAVLVAVSLPLAAPGAELVPGAATGEEGWLMGVTGAGLGLGPWTFLGLLIAATVAWAGVVALAETVGERWIWGAAALLGVAFCLAPPLLSLDVFSYIAYGRLGAVEGLNPYEAAPVDVPGDAAADRVEDWRGTPSVYGPLFTLLTYPLAVVGVAFSLWALKALSLVAVLGTALVCRRLAPRRGIAPSRAVAVVALNPLVLVHVIGGPHNDGLLALGLVTGVALGAAGTASGGAVAALAGVGVKAAGLFAAPFAVLGARERGRSLAIAVVTVGALAALALGVFGTAAVEALGAAEENQARTSTYSVPSRLAAWTPLSLGVARGALLAGYGALVAGLLAAAWRGGDPLRLAGWAGAGLLVASGWLLPWYLIWALPFAALSRDRLLLALVIALTAFQLPNGIPL